MKKSYLYFIAPLVATAIFGVFYYRYASTYEAKIAAAEKKVRDDRDAKLKEEARLREKAIADALASQEKRKQEKLAREAKEAAERDARDKAVQARDKAHQDAVKFADRVTFLKKEVKAEEETIKKIHEDQKQLVDEQAFLRDFVKKAESNTQYLNAVLEKIDAADKARIAAEKAAKKSS